MTPSGSNQQKARILKILSLAVLFLAFLNIIFLCLFPVQSGDVWWNMASGRWMVETGELLNRDVFTWSIYEKPWLNRTAVFQIMIYGVYSIAGYSGLVALRVIIILAVFMLIAFLIIKWKKRYEDTKISLPLTALIFVSGMFLLQARLYVRPELFSLLCFTGSVFLWEAARGKKGYSSFLPILILQILWTNLHGAFPLGYMIAFSYLLERMFTGKKRNYYELLFFPLLLITSLINPYGSNLVTGIFNLMSHSEYREFLHEWMPSFSSVVIFSLRWYMVFLFAAGLISSLFNIENFRLSHFIILIITFTASLLSVRHTAFFALAATITLSWNFIFIMNWCDDTVLNSKRTPVFSIILFIILALMNVFITNGMLMKMININRPFGFGVHWSRYPGLSAEFLKDNVPGGNLFHGYNSGGFLEWMLHPEFKTCIDGRYEPFPPDFINRHYRIITSQEEPDSFLVDYPVNIALIDYNERQLLWWFRMHPEWGLCFIGMRSAVFLKRIPRYRTVLDQFELPPLKKMDASHKKRMMPPSPEKAGELFPFADYDVIKRSHERMLKDLNLVDRSVP